MIASRADGVSGTAGAVAAAERVEITGENALVVECLQQPLRRALGGRPTSFSVRVDTVVRVGDDLPREA